MIAHTTALVKVDMHSFLVYNGCMKYDTVIFDLDGTLLDTLDDLRDAVNHAMRDFGLPEATHDGMRARLGNGSGYLIAHCVPGGREFPQYQEVFDDYLSYYEAHSRIKTAPYPGIMELLEELKAAGIKCAIVSNKPNTAAVQLARDFFSGYVLTAVGERPGVRRKPAPDTVLAAMAELGSAPESTVYVGDSEVDIDTAAAAGIDCISVTWGFRTREQLVESGAAVLVDDAAGLRGAIMG